MSDKVNNFNKIIGILKIKDKNELERIDIDFKRGGTPRGWTFSMIDLVGKYVFQMEDITPDDETFLFTRIGKEENLALRLYKEQVEKVVPLDALPEIKLIIEDKYDY